VVDPRYSYAVEGDVTVGLLSSLGNTAHAQAVYGAGAVFLAPVAENRQLSVGLHGGGGHDSSGTVWFSTLAVGYRSLRDFEVLQTRLDLQLLSDLSRLNLSQPIYFSLGARVGFALLYPLSQGWRAGVELGASFFAIHVRAQVEASPMVTYSW
jgi:hypothetical protein